MKKIVKSLLEVKGANGKEILVVTTKGVVRVKGKAKFKNEELAKALFEMIEIMKDYYRIKKRKLEEII